MDLRKEKSNVEQKFWDMCLEVTDQNGLGLYDLEYVPSSSTLRVFIYDPKTKTAVIEDCVKVDRAMTPHLEAPWVPESLVLEVSSPGMFRPLKSLKHFELARDQRVACILLKEVAGVKGNKVKGTLVDFNDKNISLDIDGRKVDLPVEQIKKVNLDPDY